jgi:hypothetical protein
MEKTMNFLKKYRKSRLFLSFFLVLAALNLSSLTDLSKADSHSAESPKATGESSNARGYEELVYFSGQIVSNTGKLIEAADIEIIWNEPNESMESEFSRKTGRTNDNGLFKIEVKRHDRYLMNIRKTGYRLISKFYSSEIMNGTWEMIPGTTQLIDPTINNTILDIRPQGICSGPLRSQVDWSKYPDQYRPRYIDSEGNISWDVPAEVLRAVDFVENISTCSPGITVNVPANSLVDQFGNPPQGEILASVYTVDIYDLGAMPGDFTAQGSEGIGYMISFGAGGIDITSTDGKYKYQLKKGAQATLTIPIHEYQLEYGLRPENEIPLLLYNEKNGIWEQDGIATVNRRSDAYIGEISHFSAYNMDIVKTDQSCVRIDSSGIDRDYILEVYVPTANGDFTRSKRVDNTPDKLHVIYNLPSNTNITLQAFEVTVGIPPIPISDPIVVNTGDPQDPSIPNEPVWPYYACNADVVLNESSEPPQPRQLKIINQVGSQRLDQVVQVKIIPIEDTYTNDDLLTQDGDICWNLPGEYIGLGGSRIFNVTVGDNYKVFIGMGIWETDLVAGICSIDYPWFKNRRFTDVNYNMYYVWTDVTVNGHSSDIWEWTITGSYLYGNLNVNPTDNPSISFQSTDWDPIP